MESPYNLKTLTEIEIVESASSPDTKDTSNETENSSVDDTEKSSVNLVHRMSNKIYGFFVPKQQLSMILK